MEKNGNLPVQMPTLKIYISKWMLNLALVLCSLQKQYKEDTIVNFEHCVTCFRTPPKFYVILRSLDPKMASNDPGFQKSLHTQIQNVVTYYFQGSFLIL